MAESNETKSNDKPKPRTPFYPKGCTTKGLNLVVSVYDSSSVPARPKADGSMTKPGHFVNAELSQIDGIPAGLTSAGVPQYSAALIQREQQGEDGKVRYNTGQFYTEDELASIREAIGDRGQPLYKHDAEGNAIGEPIGVVGVVTADVILSSAKLNHKSLKAYEGPLPEDIKSAQFEGSRRDVATLRAEASAKKEAKAAEQPAAAAVEAAAAEASAPEAAADEPNFG